jgi:hypothetical protein
MITAACGGDAGSVSTGEHPEDNHGSASGPDSNHGQDAVDPHDSASGDDGDSAGQDDDEGAGDSGDSSDDPVADAGSSSDDSGDGDGDTGGDGDIPSDCAAGGEGLEIGDDVVLDRATCLTWQRAEPMQPTYCQMSDKNPMGYCWTDAANQCEDLTLGGANDWRLPSEAELLTIVDKAEFPTANKEAFPNVRQQFYWTSREVNSDHAYCVDFGSGNASPSAAKWGGQAFRCVRGPAMVDPP